MDIKKFLQSSYNYEDFLKFIFEKFYGFELNDNAYELPLTETEQKHIEKYKFLGSSELDDGKEIGFFEVITTERTDIENNRVSLNNILKNKASDELLDSAIAVFHNPRNPNVWRLSFIKFSYDENNKEEVSNLKRFTYVLGNKIPIKTAYLQLKDLKYPSLQELEDAFSVEKISKEFFTKYKNLYIQLVEDITVVNESEMTTEERIIIRDKKIVSYYIKKLLGRIVFLYFVQKKRWLNNDKNFLSNLFYEYTKENPNENFYDKIMETLFFEALNDNKREDGKIKLGNNKYLIPYLNGGLFESDDLDDKNLTIPNKDFEKILELFNSYNFTVIEDTPNDSEIAIDPEMLGKVFEDLLEDRKEKGAFYTPREIVHYMCQQSIINYLSDFYDKEYLNDIKLLVLEEKTDKNLLLKNYGEDLEKKLFNIKILDPAIGSGAFPMGMLHEIVQVLGNINKAANTAQLKRKVIENCIYGIDIENSAVEIAKLRFWLSIVVDEKEPTPLPNLKYKIMVGNSLIETIGNIDILKGKSKNKNIGNLNKLFHEFFNSHENKDVKNNQIKSEFSKLFKELEKSYSNQGNLLNDNNKEIDIANNNKEIVASLKRKHYSTELFLYKLFFNEVIIDGGFNIVIGNPPYVRQEKIKELKSKKEIQAYKSYCGTADLYIYFFEKGFNLLQKNGYLTFITSNKYTKARYGKDFRKFILDNTTIREYIDFNGVKVFESATVDTSILTYQKIKIKNNSFTYCAVNEEYKKGQELESFINKRGFNYKQSDLSEDSFSFSNPLENKIKKQMESVGITLKEIDYVKTYRGLQSGNNDVFVIDEKLKNDLLEADKNSQDLIKPIVQGKHTDRYDFEFKNKYLIYVNDETNIENYPAVYSYLLKYKDILSEKIEVKQNKMLWYSLYRPAKRHIHEFNKEKISWGDNPQYASFCLLPDDYYVLAPAYILTGDKIKYILAIMNSRISFYYLQILAPSLQGHAISLKLQFLEKLPIPVVSQDIEYFFEELVNYILFLRKHKKNKYMIEFFERIIDIAVYELYFKDELHSKGFGILETFKNGLLTFDGRYETIEKVYKEFSDKKHKVAYNINFIKTLDFIKIVENK